MQFWKGFVAGGLAVGLGFGAGFFSRVSAESDVTKKLRVEELEFVNADGKTVGGFAMAVDGGPTFSLYDKAGMPCLSLHVDAQGAPTVDFASGLVNKLRLGLDADARGYVRMMDNVEKNRVVLGFVDGMPLLAISDEKQNGRIALGLDREHSPWLNFVGRDGLAVVELGEDGSGGVLGLGEVNRKHTGVLSWSGGNSFETWKVSERPVTWPRVMQ